MFKELEREADERMEEREKRRMLIEAQIEKERRAEEHAHQLEMQRMWMNFMHQMLQPVPSQYQPHPPFHQPSINPGSQNFPFTQSPLSSNQPPQPPSLSFHHASSQPVGSPSSYHPPGSPPYPPSTSD